MKWISGLLVLLVAAACQSRAGVTPSAAAAPPTPPPTPAPVQTAPSPRASIPSGCQVTTGQVLAQTLQNAHGVAFHFYVYFPPCYEASQKRYPVLYLLHGMNADDTQWLNLGLAKTADALIGAGAMPPLIIVLPRDPDIRQPAESEFDEWLLNDLLPWIDGTYRTNPNHRGLGGISRGGAWAVHIGLQHPERFQALGWHSPEIFWGDAQKIPRWLEAMPRQAIPQVYMDAGNNDTSLPRARWLQAQLRAFGVPHEWRLTLGYHEEKLWRAHLAEYLRWYGQALSP